MVSTQKLLLLLLSLYYHRPSSYLCFLCLPHYLSSFESMCHPVSAGTHEEERELPGDKAPQALLSPHRQNTFTLTSTFLPSSNRHFLIPSHQDSPSLIPITPSRTLRHSLHPLDTLCLTPTQILPHLPPRDTLCRRLVNTQTSFNEGSPGAPLRP